MSETDEDESSIQICDISYLTEMTNTIKNIDISLWLMKHAVFYVTSSVINFSVYCGYPEYAKNIYNLPNSIRSIDIDMSCDVTIKIVIIPYNVKTLSFRGKVGRVNIRKQLYESLEHAENNVKKRFLKNINYKTI